jgi:hypothetical protein
MRSRGLEPPRVAPLAPQHDGKPLIMKENQKGSIDVLPHILLESGSLNLAGATRLELAASGRDRPAFL